MEQDRSDRSLRALIEAGLSLAGELDLDQLLQKIADLARDVIGATYSAVGVLNDDGTLGAFYHSGIDEDVVRRIGHLPEGRGVLGALIEEGAPLRLKEISDHPRSYGFPPDHPAMHTFLGVPIIARGQIFGRLYLTEKRDSQEFTKDDEQLALVLAAQAGVAVENARLYGQVQERSRELAVFEERERISMELHDGVIQSIYSVGLSLQALLPVIDRDPETARSRMSRSIAMLDDVVRDVRGYIFELRPRSVAEVGLVEAIGGLVREFEVNTMIHPTMEMADDFANSLDVQDQMHILQIMREVLSNIARHAQASQVWIRCSVEEHGVGVVITDDGTGFDMDSVPKGMGLQNIQDRAAAIGGAMVIAKGDPAGTIHRLSIPLGEGGE